MKDPDIKIGQTVWWVHCSYQVYKGMVEEYSFCEYQGGLYLVLYSPSFRLNPHPIVHYSNCFATRQQAEEYAEYERNENNPLMRCDSCKFQYHISEAAQAGEESR